MNWDLLLKREDTSSNPELVVHAPVSKASREVANLTERKIHILPFMVSNNFLSVRPSIRPSVTLTPIINTGVLHKSNEGLFINYVTGVMVVFCITLGHKACGKCYQGRGFSNPQKLCNSPLYKTSYLKILYHEDCSLKLCEICKCKFW